MITRVLPDANVLYSRTLRDWLFVMRNHTKGGFYTVHSTEDIVCEVGYAYRRSNQDADGGKVDRLVNQIRGSVDSFITNFPMDPDYAGADPNDRHVHSAAITGQVDTLLTSDRGLLCLDDARYEAWTPDDFFCLADESQPHIVRAVALKQVQHFEGGDVVGMLRAAGCNRFADKVARHLTEVLRLPLGEETSHTLELVATSLAAIQPPAKARGQRTQPKRTPRRGKRQ